MANTFSEYSEDLLQKTDFAAEIHEYRNQIENPYYHYHDHYEILYVYKGERTLTINDADSALNEFSIAFIPPYCIHKTSSHKNHYSKRILINFSMKFIDQLAPPVKEKLLMCFTVQNNIITFGKKAIEELIPLFQDIIYYQSQPKDGFSDVRNLLFLGKILLIANENNYNRHIDKEYIEYSHLIMKISEYIENNHQDQICLDALSEKFNISKYTISRTFRSITGYSFVQYLNNIRIIHAQNILVSTSQKITDIAYTCGFDSATHFERCFKKITGITPKEYRKKYRFVSD